jgi:hypothetical protein
LKRRRSTSSVFKNTVDFRKSLVVFVGDDACAPSFRQSQFYDPLQKTVFSCLELRAASSAICRDASCEPTRPIATDSASYLQTSKLARHLGRHFRVWRLCWRPALGRRGRYPSVGFRRNPLAGGSGPIHSRYGLWREAIGTLLLLPRLNSCLSGCSYLTSRS